jgi:hypothetical protein
MPFGVEEHELEAYINLYERRQEVLQRLKSRTTLAAASKSGTCVAPRFKRIPGASLPPPSYTTGEDSRTENPSKDTTTTDTVIDNEAPPPYSAATSEAERSRATSFQRRDGSREEGYGDWICIEASDHEQTGRSSGEEGLHRKESSSIVGVWKWLLYKRVFP